MNHGSRGTYRAGCRCADCREANAIYVRNRRREHGRPSRRKTPVHSSTEALMVTCWCERHYGLVDPGDVRAGRTFSCGRDDCCEPMQVSA